MLFKLGYTDVRTDLITLLPSKIFAFEDVEIKQEWLNILFGSSSVKCSSYIAWMTLWIAQPGNAQPILALWRTLDKNLQDSIALPLVAALHQQHPEMAWRVWKEKGIEFDKITEESWHRVLKTALEEKELGSLLMADQGKNQSFQEPVTGP